MEAGRERERLRACRVDLDASDSDSELPPWARRPYRTRCAAYRCVLMYFCACMYVWLGCSGFWAWWKSGAVLVWFLGAHHALLLVLSLIAQLLQGKCTRSPAAGTSSGATGHL